LVLAAVRHPTTESITFSESIAWLSQLKANTKIAMKYQIQNQFHAGHEIAS
jgi:hypothetical protein